MPSCLSVPFDVESLCFSFALNFLSIGSDCDFEKTFVVFFIFFLFTHILFSS
jgi:hypothetical protein